MKSLTTLGLVLVLVFSTYPAMAASGAQAEPSIPDDRLPGENDRDFTLTTDPTIAVLEVTVQGGASGERHIYQLFVDGRFWARHLGRGGRVTRETEGYLDFDEVRNLVGLAVDHGLVEADTEDLWRRARGVVPPGRHFNTGTDNGEIVVALDLEHYILDGEDQGHVSKRVVLQGPKIFHQVLPSAPEPKVMIELEQRCRAVERQVSNPRNM